MEHVLDRACRALHYAHTAFFALFMIDDTEIVLNLDSSEFTGLRAQSAADAGSGAVFARLSALLGVVAADEDLGFVVGNDLDQTVGAGLDAGAAAGALVAVDDSYALD